MISVTNDFINLIPEPGKIKDSYITYDDKQVKPQTTTISFQGDLFKTIMREIDLEIKDNENIIDKEFNAKYGLYVNGSFEYIDYGTFKVTECEEVIKENKIKATSYDNMVKFMVKYDLTNLGISFPCTILELVQAMCNHVTVGLYSTNFYNANLVIPEDLFTVLNCTYRDVLDYICQATCTTGIIKDDKLYLKKIEDHRDFVVGPKLLKTITFKSKFGPCNSLVLGRGDLNDNIYSKDDTSIATYGLQEIKFDNNEIIDKQREEVIDNMFEQIKGIEYNAFEATDLGIGFFECADLITAQDLLGNTYDILILGASITITSGIAGTMESNTPGASTTNYSYATDSEKRQSRTEINVNKQEKVIESVVQEQTETNERLTETIQTVEEITDTVKEVQENTEQSINEIKETSDAFSVAISKVGGDNLIKNSAMINEKNFWFSAIKNAYTESEIPPENPVEGDYWYCTADYAGYVANQMYVYQSGTWIQSNYTREELNNLLNLLENVSSNEYFVDGTKASEKSFSGRTLLFDGKNDFSVTHIFCVGEPISLNDTEEYIIYSYSIKNNISLGVAYIGVMFLETDQFTPVEIPYSIYEPAIIYTPDDAKNLTKIEQKIKIPKKEDFIEVVASQVVLEDTSKIWLDTTINLPKQYNTETSMWEILNTTMSLYEYTTRHVWTYRGIFGSYYETPVNFDDMQIKSFFPAVTFYPSFSVYTGDTEPTPQKGLYWNNQTTDLVKRAKYGKQLNEETGEQEEVFEEWEIIPIPSSMLPTGEIIALPQIPYIVPLQGFFEVLDLKLEYNVIATNWTQYPGEVYTKNYKMDERGFSIESRQNIMFIDEDEILATYKGLNIFQINKDLAYFKKIEVDESINIGDFTLKQQTINSKKFLLLY